MTSVYESGFVVGAPSSTDLGSALTLIDDVCWCNQTISSTDYQILSVSRDLLEPEEWTWVHGGAIASSQHVSGEITAGPTPEELLWRIARLFHVDDQLAERIREGASVPELAETLSSILTGT